MITRVVKSIALGYKIMAFCCLIVGLTRFKVIIIVYSFGEIYYVVYTILAMVFK